MTFITNAENVRLIDAQGKLVADNVEGALTELATDKATKESPTFTGTVTLPSNTSVGNVSATELIIQQLLGWMLQINFHAL